MKKLSLLLSLLITIFFADAQKKQIDTLRLALSKTRADSTRFIALINLNVAYYLPNPDSAIIFGQQAYLLAKKNNWLVRQADCLNNIANDYGVLADYVKTIQFYL